jgi:hypothetical protein
VSRAHSGGHGRGRRDDAGAQLFRHHHSGAAQVRPCCLLLLSEACLPAPAASQPASQRSQPAGRCRSTASSRSPPCSRWRPLSGVPAICRRPDLQVAATTTTTMTATACMSSHGSAIHRRPCAAQVPARGLDPPAARRLDGACTGGGIAVPHHARTPRQLPPPPRLLIDSGVCGTAGT